MDGTLAIENNRQALKRIIASLIAMAGLADGAKTLPRVVRIAALRLLRPAEAAARRLVIALAHGLVVTLRPKPEPAAGRTGAANRLQHPRPWLSAKGAASMAAARGESRPPSFSLCDPLRRSGRPRRHVSASVPRILFPGVVAPRPIATPPSPQPGDPVEATRLTQRLAVLGRVLDDLPRHALRFARWTARRDRAAASGRWRRFSPLRPGHPPGGRISRYDPSARQKGGVREVDEILAHAHSLAVFALERRDTS